mmetsp:Transcript_28658/g.111904  ORF Transcript_28658/g.111904 Transcript_28658/m.111904 type:complete len:335 (-) Transcript_28658:583-1587(-)
MIGFVAGWFGHHAAGTPESRHAQCRRVQSSFRALVRVQASADEPGGQGSVLPTALPVSSTWEIDFYSRPVIGADGKKLWELIITDKNGNFEHVESVPNSMVNSKELRRRVQAVVDESPTKPKTLRFFRAQMQNMIKIALSSIEDIVIVPSRRTYSLLEVIEDRETNVYPKMKGYRAISADPFSALSSTEVKVGEKMPDSLRGEKFAFVTLELGQIRALEPEDVGFGEICPIPQSLSDDLTIPGICVYSGRAGGLAGWLSGSEIAAISALVKQREIFLECGLNTNFLFARISEGLRTEAKAYEKQKTETQGLHFLAVQTTPEAEEVAGFWLLRTI